MSRVLHCFKAPELGFLRYDASISMQASDNRRGRLPDSLPFVTRAYVNEKIVSLSKHYCDRDASILMQRACYGVVTRRKKETQCKKSCTTTMRWRRTRIKCKNRTTITIAPAGARSSKKISCARAFMLQTGLVSAYLGLRPSYFPRFYHALGKHLCCHAKVLLRIRTRMCTLRILTRI